jgi:hypothetical protein
LENLSTFIFSGKQFDAEDEDAAFVGNFRDYSLKDAGHGATSQKTWYSAHICQNWKFGTQKTSAVQSLSTERKISIKRHVPFLAARN